MPNLNIIFAVFVIITAGIMMVQYNLTKYSPQSAANAQIQNPSASPINKDLTTTPTPTLTEPKIDVSITPSDDIVKFIYPTSIVLNQNPVKIELESNDNPDTITSWYKSKVEDKGFKNRNFIQTNTNGNILNTISASSDSKRVLIEITKTSGASTTKINVKLNN